MKPSIHQQKRQNLVVIGVSKQRMYVGNIDILVSIITTANTISQEVMVPLCISCLPVYST